MDVLQQPQQHRPPAARLVVTDSITIITKTVQPPPSETVPETVGGDLQQFAQPRTVS
jgi:hypothetical protein